MSKASRYADETRVPLVTSLRGMDLLQRPDLSYGLRQSALYDGAVRRLLARGRGSDDTEEVIEPRLEVYMEHTVPMLDYYELREELVRVDGGRTPDEVSWALVSRLEQIRRTLAL